MMFRESRLGELKDEIALLWRTLPFWTVEAYKAAERSFRLVEAEESAKDPKDKKGADMAIRKTGSKVFAKIEAHEDEKRRAQERAESLDFETQVEEIAEAFEEDTGLEDEIFDFFRDLKNE